MNPLGVATLAQLKYAVFDIETTGFSRTNDRIIQIAAIKVEGKGLSQNLKQKVMMLNPKNPLRNDSEIFNGFINPGRKIPQKIVDLTNITDSMVHNQPDEKTILQEFKNFVGDRILVAHNGIRFDIPFIEAAAKRNKVKIENLLCFDTLWLSRNLFPNNGPHNVKTLVENHKIKNKYPFQFISQQHNAYVDVVITIELLKVFNRELKRRGKDRLLIISD